jgi:hypothetical protein
MKFRRLCFYLHLILARHYRMDAGLKRKNVKTELYKFILSQSMPVSSALSRVLMAVIVSIPTSASFTSPANSVIASNPDADCSPDAKCTWSNVSGESRCVTGATLIDPVPPPSPISNQPCSTTSDRSAGYRCGRLAVGHC